MLQILERLSFVLNKIDFFFCFVNQYRNKSRIMITKMSEPKTKTCEKHVSEKEKQAFMKTIEKTTEKVVSLAMKNGMIVSPLNADPKKVEDSANLLVGIMNVGAEAFQEKMGRQMSYSEMRQMYG